MRAGIPILLEGVISEEVGLFVNVCEDCLVGVCDVSEDIDINKVGDWFVLDDGVEVDVCSGSKVENNDGITVGTSGDEDGKCVGTSAVVVEKTVESPEDNCE